MKPRRLSLCALALAACSTTPPSLPEASGAAREIDTQLAEGAMAPVVSGLKP